MSATHQPRSEPAGLTRTRLIAAAIGAVVVLDVLWVRAPFLILLGVPFMVAAWRYRGRHAVSNVALAVFCILYAVVGVSYAVNNGLNAPAEPGQTASTINPGDFAAVYIGTPLAMLLGARIVGSVLRRGRVEQPAAVA